MNKRFQRRGHKKKKRTIPKGYDSQFEYDLHKLMKGCEYHPEKVSYTSHHTYEPDFIPKEDDDILIEAKGRFRDRKEASKYVAIQNSNPHKQVIFIFYNPTCAMPGARIRKKCGTRQTHAEWADTNGFTWYTISTLPKEWRK